MANLFFIATWLDFNFCFSKGENYTDKCCNLMGWTCCFSSLSDKDNKIRRKEFSNEYHFSINTIILMKNLAMKPIILWILLYWKEYSRVSEFCMDKNLLITYDITFLIVKQVMWLKMIHIIRVLYTAM